MEKILGLIEWPRLPYLRMEFVLREVWSLKAVGNSLVDYLLCDETYLFFCILGSF